MDNETLLARLLPGQPLLLSAYQPPLALDVPVFFEPLDAQAIAQAFNDAWLVAVVLDGDQPQGQEWIARIRELCHMTPGNTRSFGDAPYFYAFRDSRPPPPGDPVGPTGQGRGRELQYLVHVQGASAPAIRRRIALAMLRQWVAEGTGSHRLARIKPEYLEPKSRLLRLPDGEPRWLAASE